MQASVSKCGNSMGNVVRHMADIVTHLATSSADFSAEGHRGSPRTGNSGLIDTILLKKKRPSVTSATSCRSNLGSRAMPPGYQTSA